jgi:hypothetical protein
MNPNRLEQLLLLEQAGELTPRQRRTLDAELTASATARRLRAELQGLAAALPPVPAAPAPGAPARIAARLRKADKPAFIFRPAWRPALVAAAAFALLLGVRSYQGRPGPGKSAPAVAAAQEEEWTDPLDAEFTELESLIAAMSADDSFEITEL